MTITHACGHERQHDYVGPAKRRRRWENKLAKRRCRDCRKARKWTKHRVDLDAETIACASVAAALGLPYLAGTDREMREAVPARHAAAMVVDSWPEPFRAIALGRIGAIRTAAWWIHVRDDIELCRMARDGTAAGLYLVQDEGGLFHAELQAEGVPEAQRVDAADLDGWHVAPESVDELPG